jgi:type II secretory pathway component PulK
MGMSRAALIQAELLVAVVALMALGLLAADAAREHRRAAALENQAAALETARNLLARARAGAEADAPAGWTLVRSDLPGAQRVTVRGAGIELSTVVPR